MRLMQPYSDILYAESYLDKLLYIIEHSEIDELGGLLKRVCACSYADIAMDIYSGLQYDRDGVLRFRMTII